MFTRARQQLARRRSAVPSLGCALVLCLLVGVVGCKDLTGSPGLPAGTQNPAFYSTPSGALGMRTTAIYVFEQALSQYVVDAGLLTDELEDEDTGNPGVNATFNTVSDPLDERILPASVTVVSYGDLQAVRTYATQAIGALAIYDTTVADTATAKVLRGELYAVEGYTEIMLADLFCSGVPLSTLVFQGDFNYAPSSTTQQVYQAALAKFDTALTLADTSSQVRSLAQVGQGRAYLDLGPQYYQTAADDVTTVPDDFQYQLAIDMIKLSGNLRYYIDGTATVSNREGINGLPFLSSGDPRTAVESIATIDENGNPLVVPLTIPTKYSAGLSGLGYAPFTLASGVEARLIQAEAALNGVATGHGSWIDQLNALRATVSGLPQITDPGAGNPEAQIDTVFTERAEWLFLTGHRQGDLRRLLRQYGGRYAAFNDPSKVYPTGPYNAPGTGLYGMDVTAPIPVAEEANPLFHGCLSREP
jgi:hypothetical protein